MERVLDVRRPPEQSQTGLSRVSKIFFGCDIFQGKLCILDSYVPIRSLENENPWTLSVN